MRQASRRDTAEPAIVDALEACGFRVWRLQRPVDLLIYGGGKWQLMEVKTPTSTGKRRSRQDQKEQDEFIASTSTPVCWTVDMALKAVGAVT
jgi:hypothetical protein